MKKNFFKLAFLMLSTLMYGQAGHVMQGLGAVNMSMGGASTAQPLDISGALQWNPICFMKNGYRQIFLWNQLHGFKFGFCSNSRVFYSWVNSCVKNQIFCF